MGFMNRNLYSHDAATTRGCLDRDLPAEHFCAAHDIRESKTFMSNFFVIESYAIIGDTEFDVFVCFFERELDDEITGAGMFYNVIDLFLDNAKKHELYFVA